MAYMVSNADKTFNVTVGNTKGVRSSKAAYVQYGYGQVEPNHLSAQRTGQIYAQLPAKNDIDMLENGQFVKYDYAEGVCNYTGSGEWMLVYNEVKVYHDRDTDADFALKKDNYVARIYNALNADMPTGSTMVPRVFKTNVGDIMTTNTVDATTLKAKDILTVDPRSGLLVLTDKVNEHSATAGTVGSGDTVLTPADGDMLWQVAKVYTLGDRQQAVKIMRIQ